MIPETSAFQSQKRPRTPNLGSPRMNVPPLPELNGDVLLEVFTHKSIRRPFAHDNERLSELGTNVYSAIVTVILFSQGPPLLDVNEIEIRRGTLLSGNTIERLTKIYQLREKLRCHPDVVPSLDSPEEGYSVFMAYVGGLYAQRGLQVVQDWIDKLVDFSSQQSELHPRKKIKSDSLDESRTIRVNANGSNDADTPNLPSSNPHKRPNPLAPAQPHLPFFALFNSAVTQRGVKCDYNAQFSGPPHAGIWTVKCMVNDIEKGVGTGRNKQVAKEEAALQAYYALGWAPHG